MRPVIFSVFILLMATGNCLAAYKLFTAKQEFMEKFPKLTDPAYAIFRLLPFVNLVALAGLWFFQSWAAYLAVACALVVIAFDIYFSITYHLYVAIPSFVLLLLFIIKYWNHFK